MKTKITFLFLLVLLLGSSELKSVNNFNALSLDAFLMINRESLSSFLDFNTLMEGRNFEAERLTCKRTCVPKELKFSREKDTLKKAVPYRVLKCSPSLRYTIRKIGNGNMVLFSLNNGLTRLPELSFGQTSGNEYYVGRKQGFENVLFPFKCRLSCTVNFNEIATLLNDFDLEIYEPGYWEILFSH